MKKKIFLDMDGVLCDFVGAALALHGFLPNALDNAQGNYDIEQNLKIDTDKFWKTIDEDINFWKNLQPTKEFNQLINYVTPASDSDHELFILTSPSFDPGCFSGKVEWIKKHLPHLERKLIITSKKYLLAANDRHRILIDDSDTNINAFKKAGGTGILFPRPWNSRFAFANDPLDLVFKEVNRFLR